MIVWVFDWFVKQMCLQKVDWDSWCEKVAWLISDFSKHFVVMPTIDVSYFVSIKQSTHFFIDVKLYTFESMKMQNYTMTFTNYQQFGPWPIQVHDFKIHTVNWEHILHALVGFCLHHSIRHQSHGRKFQVVFLRKLRSLILFVLQLGDISLRRSLFAYILDICLQFMHAVLCVYSRTLAHARTHSTAKP